MTKLSVNVNKVALLRNSRLGNIPSVTKAARIALEAGAHGITVHPRPDERHIRRTDVAELAALLDEPAHQEAELNIEGNPYQGGYMELVARARPDQCTLVPDDPGQLTSDHGWDIVPNLKRLQATVATLKKLGCRVSLFLDPEPDAIDRVPDTGADRIELYTEGYAAAYAKGGKEREQAFARYARAAERAAKHNLGVNAGHDLNLDNLRYFLRIPNILEVSIGHALIADALERGMQETVKRYLEQLQ